jgi:hypothetical protein
VNGSTAQLSKREGKFMNVKLKKTAALVLLALGSAIL